MVLQSIRERLTGILAFAILGILIIPFALVGVNEYFTSSAENVVARINETEITTNDFNQSFSDYRRRMQSLMGEAYDPVQFDQLISRREHLDSLINQELINQAAQSMGLDVDDETLAAEIRRIPAFQVEGVFNADVYQSRLIAQGMSSQQFQNEMRAQFVTNQLPRNITDGSITTRAELQEFTALRDQTRTFGAVLIEAEEPEVAVVFSEDEISEWYAAHPEEYQSQEQVVIEYVELDSATLPEASPPEEDFLREQFEVQASRFISPEQRRVSHILLEVSPDAEDAAIETARQTAADLVRRARAGEDFASLARENSGDMGSASEGGDLGWVEPGIMVKAFENAMYELSMEAPISEPIQTGFGWHVIQINEIREASGMGFEEARALLVKEYQDDTAARAFLEQADRLVDLVYEDPTTLESAALVLGLTVAVTDPFTREGGQGVAANPEVSKEAFSDLVLLQGSVSDPINLDDNHLVMIRLREHLPVAVIPLEQVRDEIVASLSDRLARNRSRARAEQLLATAQTGDEDFSSVAESGGLEYIHHEAIRRNAIVPDAMLVKEIFRLQIAADSEPLLVMLPATNGFAVVALESISNGGLDDNVPLAQQQYRRILANSSASQEVWALMRQLRASSEVEIFEDRIR